MHFLIATAGSAGDVYPFIAIGRALAERGHAVELMGARPYEAAVRGAGLAFMPVGAPGEFERVVAAPELWDPRRGLELIVRETLAHLGAAVEQARAALRPDTLLVGSTLAWNVRLLQEQLGLPAATVHLSPSCILSADAPPRLPVVGDLHWLPAPLLRRLFAVIEQRRLDPLIAPGLNRLRATLGLAPVAHVMSQWANSPDLVIGAWPAWFAPRQPDWPPQADTAGFPRWQRTVDPAALDPALLRFLDAGPPPIGITPGSAMAHGRGFLTLALAACAEAGRRALVVTPYADQLPPSLPAGSHHVAYVPFEWLVPRLAALVHHGGIGTCAQALAAGVPQLVAPFAHDQFDNGARIQRLGVGRWLGARAGRRRWANALRRVVDDGAVRERCAAVAARLQADGNAAERIADRLEALGRLRAADSPSR